MKGIHPCHVSEMLETRGKEQNSQNPEIGILGSFILHTLYMINYM